jgi:pimeloyl-ACP methyl ester carboxylesterase
MRTATATNGEVQIHYDVFGDAAHPTLLLVNGLGSQCINYKDAWCELFVAGHDYPPQLWRRWTDLVVDHIRAHS